MAVNLITILGPTATGKTKLASQLAFHFNGEIISADSRQVYTGMTIGTGKDLGDYSVNGQNIKYHMIDLVNPEDEFNVFSFKKNFNKYFSGIIQRGKLPFLTGGTGFYISSVIQNYKISKADFSAENIAKLESLTDQQLTELLIRMNPKQHNTTDLVTRKRMIRAILVEYAKAVEQVDEEAVQAPPVSPLVIGIKLPRDIVRERITARLKERLETGMIKEVENLIVSGVSYQRLFEFGLEYKYIAMYLKGDLTFSDMFKTLNTAIHRFSKRQMTWFRKMEREGTNINWIEGPDYETAKSIILPHI